MEESDAVQAGDAAPVADPDDLPPPQTDREDEVGWLELFFDLVVVAAIAVLAEGVRASLGLRDVGMLTLEYAAIWMTWIGVVLYANLAQAATHIRTVLIVMVLIAMMAGSAPLSFPARANAFALGFIVSRIVLSRSSIRTGKVLAGWPLLQFGGLLTPWIVAMWVPTPAKFWLWAAGLVVDITLVVVRPPSDEIAVARLEHRLNDRQSRSNDSRGTIRMPQHLISADVDTSHLDVRLGSFVIIVIGEAVSQLVADAADQPWTTAFRAAALAAFAILVGLWWTTFSYGFAAAPHTRLATMPPRFGLPLHLISTGSIVCLATGLGSIVVEPVTHPNPVGLWLACGGLATHFAVSGIGGFAARAPRAWLYGRALPCALAPLAVGVIGYRLDGAGVAAGLAVVVAWQVVYGLKLVGQK